MEQEGGNNYQGTLSRVVNDPKIWRVMYGGYFGKKWNQTTVENDDDWYMVTKVAVQCIVNATPPKTVFQVPNRIANSDKALGFTLADIQRRGTKILDECEKLYWYAKNGSEDYTTAKIELEKSGSLYEVDTYIVQDYVLSGNKDISSYNVTLRNFPEGTIYDKSGNTVKVKIPKASIDNNYTGVVMITNAKVETYPCFYCQAKNDDYQDYIVIADPYEITSTRAIQEVEGNTATLNVIKSDEEDKKPIADVTFNIRYENGENLGNYTTDENGKITIPKLKAGKIIIKEDTANLDYILDETPYEVTLAYDTITNIEITNEHKKGDLKIYKVDKDNHKIALGNVEFDLYSNEYEKVIGTYKTSVDGEIFIENLRTRFL